MKKKVMTIYHNQDKYGETEFFLDQNKVITAIDGNDGNYRDEYMNCLFTNFGIEVERAKKLTKEQQKSIKDYAEEYNIGSEEEY